MGSFGTLKKKVCQPLMDFDLCVCQCYTYDFRFAVPVCAL